MVKKGKHVPERTCIGCYQKKQKREMIRIVRTSYDVVKIDTSGKMPGRGAYLCRMQDCWDTSFKKKRIEHALKMDFTPYQRTELLELSKKFIAGDEISALENDV